MSKRVNLYTLMVKEVNGSSIISITTITDQKLRGGRSNPLQGKVQKIMSHASVMVFQNANTYEAMVRNRLIKEGKEPDFTMQPRVWGERVEGTPFIYHKGNYYLEVIRLTPGKITFTVDGVEIDYQDIIGLEYTPEASQGGLNNKVLIRLYDVKHIKEVKCNGQLYESIRFDPSPLPRNPN